MTLMLSLLLAGCVLDGFDLPAGYRPAPQAVKKGCVEEWCKQALAVTDAHLEELKLRMRKLRAELRTWMHCSTSYLPRRR